MCCGGQANVVAVLALVDEYRLGARFKDAKLNTILPGGDSYSSVITTSSVLKNYVRLGIDDGGRTNSAVFSFGIGLSLHRYAWGWT